MSNPKTAETILREALELIQHSYRVAAGSSGLQGGAGLIAKQALEESATASPYTRQTWPRQSRCLECGQADNASPWIEITDETMPKKKNKGQKFEVCSGRLRSEAFYDNRGWQRVHLGGKLPFSPTHYRVIELPPLPGSEV